MSTPPPNKTTWKLNPENFAQFLAALDPDPEQAGVAYERLRRSLASLFDWRGSKVPEELADETLNRLARKIEQGESIRNLTSYAGGMARLVWLETLKKGAREQRALESFGANGPSPEMAEADRSDCLERCLEKLSRESRHLILKYYSAEKGGQIAGRKRLAELLGMPLNALRIRAHRIRVQLEKCVVRCLETAELK